uniref:Fibronectin type-III domain-containing protein n=1 Tax=Neogobius melanostomus TaxID=47308 RepID=A0A8C6SM79_9GOBI
LTCLTQLGTLTLLFYRCILINYNNGHVLQSLLGHYERSFGVFPTDQHIEEGSDAEIICQSVSGKVFWTLNNKRVNESLSRRVNSTHTVLLLPSSLLQDPSHPMSIVECHTDDSNPQILGGTTVRIYSKCYFVVIVLRRCWEHHINTPLKVNYSVMWLVHAPSGKDLLSTFPSCFHFCFSQFCGSLSQEVLNKTLTPGEEGRLTIDTVESCHEYNVSVRCALDQAPWSYWSPNKTVLTKLKSLFYVKNIDTKHELNGLIVHWTAPSQPVTGYVIDWTHSGNEFDWKRTEFTNATLQGLADKRPYNITVTPLFDHKTGPSTQISGVCSSFANPGNVTIDNLEAYDTSAHVSWSIRQQERCSDAVVNYTIFYGTTDGPKFNVTVTNSNTQEVYLKNLKPGTYYSVHVVARAHSGPSKSSEGISDLLYIKIYERPVPNPGLSSLALWPQTTHPKVKRLLVFAHPLIKRCDQRNQTIPSPQDYERLYLSARTPHQCSARDSMSRLNSESSQFNPYRSQRADIPVPRTSKQSKLLAMRLQEKTPSYVSLDMFDS